jgi:P-type E1-E2 ATPase
MLTEDNRGTAAAVSKQLGLEAAEAGIEAAGKLAQVKNLGTEGKHVVRAGDGSNDAFALSEAEVGIATGTGAIIREVIDVLGVLNALRAAFPPKSDSRSQTTFF